MRPDASRSAVTAHIMCSPTVSGRRPIRSSRRSTPASNCRPSRPMVTSNTGPCCRYNTASAQWALRSSRSASRRCRRARFWCFWAAAINPSAKPFSASRLPCSMRSTHRARSCAHRRSHHRPPASSPATLIARAFMCQRPTTDCWSAAAMAPARSRGGSASSDPMANANGRPGPARASPKAYMPLQCGPTAKSSPSFCKPGRSRTPAVGISEAGTSTVMLATGDCSNARASTSRAMSSRSWPTPTSPWSAPTRPRGAPN